MPEAPQEAKEVEIHLQSALGLDLEEPLFPPEGHLCEVDMLWVGNRLFPEFPGSTLRRLTWQGGLFVR